MFCKFKKKKFKLQNISNFLETKLEIVINEKYLVLINVFYVRMYMELVD